ncbi:MAG TPA: BatA domain-containing protein [Fluviicola sp.]|nr:BatA domain-containing protein [Fluviicola sp.]
MKWVYPEFLFALAVILIPLLIHLFHFKRYKTVFFSSLTFLKSVEQNQKNTRKLKYWLIFTARALAFSFLVFAFAQPFVPLKEESNKSGVNVIGIYIDNSFSMTRIGVTGELFSQSRELAKSIVQDAPRTAQFVLITNELSGSEKQTLTKAQFLEKIEKIKPTSLVRKAADVTNWWEQWLVDNKANDLRIASSQLIYLSDFQKSTTGVLPKYKNWETMLYPVKLEPVNNGNLYIDSIWFATPVQKKEAKQTLYVRLRNEGETAVNTVDVNIRIGKIDRDVFADIPSNGSDTVELSYFNNEPGKIQGSVKVNDRQMNMDDSYYFSYDVRKQSNVLIIDGESAVSNINVVYGLDDFYKTSSVQQNQLTESNLQDKDLVVVNGCNQISANTTDLLMEFANDGGSILLFPGANTSIGGWNGLLSRLKLPALSQLQENGLTVRKINTKDPFFDGVFERKPEQLNLPAVKKAFRLQSNSASESIDLLTFQSGNSFFVRGTGKFNAYLSATSLDQTYSSFTSNQLFSTLLLRIGELSQRQAPYYLIIGEDGSYPIGQPRNAEQAVHLKKGDIDFIPTVFKKRQTNFISVQGLEAIRQLESGNYSVVSGGEKLGALSINYNRSESRIQSLTEPEIMSTFENANIKTMDVRSTSGWTGASFLQLDQPITYWKWCVIFALIFLLTEMLIVYFWKH